MESSGNSKKSGSGFDFAKAVQGVKPARKPLPNVSVQTKSGSAVLGQKSFFLQPAQSRSSMDVDQDPVSTGNRFSILEGGRGSAWLDQNVGTGTRFSELDIPASIKRTALVESPPDLYPQDPMGEDVSEAKKEAILSRLTGPSKAVRACDMYDWVQGEHNFFEDQVKLLGLDFDYSIEDVESDDESGTAQFFANQLKSDFGFYGFYGWDDDPVNLDFWLGYLAHFRQLKMPTRGFGFSHFVGFLGLGRHIPKLTFEHFLIMHATFIEASLISNFRLISSLFLGLNAMQQ
ncbi:hypothetical protein L1987_19761 [Smallanthus sonchifolius]|uniref:Uncharacterized protein n=1 Tax=Smallanthus sonchifolius TaxID=185202 RepID=A0ACB9IRR7_9ASTR|nr:hypothetical protein L1987_19761 [Smallanthus sonchifolius]